MNRFEIPPLERIETSINFLLSQSAQSDVALSPELGKLIPIRLREDGDSIIRIGALPQQADAKRSALARLIGVSLSFGTVRVERHYPFTGIDGVTQIFDADRVTGAVTSRIIGEGAILEGTDNLDQARALLWLANSLDDVARPYPYVTPYDEMVARIGIEHTFLTEEFNFV